METTEDLAAKLRAFASDGVVVKHIIEFALLSKKRANAAEVIKKGAPAADSGPATEHTRSTATEHASEPKKRLRKKMKIRTM